MPARWCEDFRAQFEALVAARPAVAAATAAVPDVARPRPRRVADAPAALAADVRAAVRRVQAEAPRMAEVQAEEDEYLGFV